MRRPKHQGQVHSREIWRQVRAKKPTRNPAAGAPAKQLAQLPGGCLELFGPLSRSIGTCWANSSSALASHAPPEAELYSLAWGHPLVLPLARSARPQNSSTARFGSRTHCQPAGKEVQAAHWSAPGSTLQPAEGRTTPLFLPLASSQPRFPQPWNGLKKMCLPTVGRGGSCL